MQSRENLFKSEKAEVYVENGRVFLDTEAKEHTGPIVFAGSLPDTADARAHLISEAKRCSE